MALFFILLILQLFYLIISKEYDCKWTHISDKKDLSNSTYDLCLFQLTKDSQSSYWEVYDNRDYSQTNFTYIFNICGDILDNKDLNEPMCFNETLRKIDSKPLGYCSDIRNNTCYNSSINTIDIDTGAYQIHRAKDNHDCYRLHDGITPPEWSLIDKTDPTRGVSITYKNGDWCAEYGKNREFIINFNCRDNFQNVPDFSEEIFEDPTNACTYIMEIDSSMGCPLECPLIDYKLCNNNGVCKYDETNFKSRCFCFSGYYGDDCSFDYDPYQSIEIVHNNISDIVILIVIVVLLTLIMIIIIYLLLRIYQDKIKINGLSSVISSISNTQNIKKQKNNSKLSQPLANDNNDQPDIVI